MSQFSESLGIGWIHSDGRGNWSQRFRGEPSDLARLTALGDSVSTRFPGLLGGMWRSCVLVSGLGSQRQDLALLVRSTRGVSWSRGDSQRVLTQMSIFWGASSALADDHPVRER